MAETDPTAARKKFVFYRYDPSLVAAIIFVVLFFFSTTYHLFQAYRRKTYYFIPLIIGGFFEWIGYIGRALARNNKNSLSIYIMQTLLLLLAPALFAASIYMVLGRLVLYTKGESRSPIRQRWLTKIFVTGDVLSFLVQSGGGGLMAGAKTQNMGKILVVAGLAIQIIFFGVFTITSAIFHWRIHRSPTPESASNPWVKYIYALYAASILILIRSLFRVIEFLGGNEGTLMSNEVYLYIFDAVLMLGVVAIFNLVHPGDIIGRKKQDEDIQFNDN